MTLMSEKPSENRKKRKKRKKRHVTMFQKDRKNSSNRTIQRRERVYEWDTHPASYFSSDNEQWIY